METSRGLLQKSSTRCMGKRSALQEIPNSSIKGKQNQNNGHNGSLLYKLQLLWKYVFQDSSLIGTSSDVFLMLIVTLL